MRSLKSTSSILKKSLLLVGILFSFIINSTSAQPKAFSTETQKLDLQLKALKGCDKIYKEQASSIQHRPELIKLLALIQPGDTLKVYKLDRLGRSTIDLINIVTHLKENNIQFISVTDNIDTSTATGKLIFTVFAAFAEFERNLISERTIAGLKATKENG